MTRAKDGHLYKYPEKKLAWDRNHKERLRIYAQNYNATHKKEVAEYRRRYRLRIKLEVFNHYSNGEMCCACCGEKHIEFLSIDHINGGGEEHRKKKGSYLYMSLKAEGFPTGYRVLCHNCNQSLGFYGYCPHQKLEKQELRYNRRNTGGH